MARFTGGWFKAWRKAWESDLSESVYLWALWNALLHMATWKETKVLWAGQQRVLPPGSVVFGFRELAAKFEVSRNTVAKWSQYLHDTQRIVLEKSPHGCIATICNWELYQSGEVEEQPQSDHDADAVRTQSGHTLSHGAALSEEDKKERTKSNARSRERKSEFDLESVYKKYPRKQGKQNGLKKLTREITTLAEFEDLNRAVDRFAAHHRARGTEPDFIPYFSTFVSSWRDWLDPETGTTQAAPQPKLKGMDDLEAMA